MHEQGAKAAIPVDLAQELLGGPEPQTDRTKQTAKRAVQILLAKQAGFHEPTRREREALAVAFARHRKVIYGAAFDVVRLARPMDLTTPDAISADIPAIELLEVKSTNRSSIPADFRTYFFNLTTAELLVAQSLGAQYKFAFVNTLTGDHLELSLRDVFARARGIYPTWSIKF